MVTQKVHRWEISSSSSQLPYLFAETMKKGQISFADWYELITTPLDKAFNAEDEDAITRMIYGVRHGFVKVVEKI
ncbi:MAG TPA: hypothetical protein DDZ80_15990 [Cyanobacteria bacterium UBA8803]|nr:hypothetical protein [Cyanobacteria bacterium UBA9273]HBL59916.1 hypothetical protein [Cyanobacteria bacterium UBA8803]